MPAGALNAMPRRPSSAACFAPASVPECQIELPRLKPRLQPDSTRSTFPHLKAPSETQSAGVPFTRYASGPTMRVARNESGRLAVIAWPIDDCSTLGATIRTVPNADATSASAAMPGL